MIIDDYFLPGSCSVPLFLYLLSSKVKRVRIVKLNWLRKLLCFVYQCNNEMEMLH